MPKDEATASLARKRWRGTTQKERSAELSRVCQAGVAALTPEQRSAIATKAAQARWAKKNSKT
jgi:hypothetical protein